MEARDGRFPENTGFANAQYSDDDRAGCEAHWAFGWARPPRTALDGAKSYGPLGRRQQSASLDSVMPKGPRGERRPADVVGAAVRVARISVGDEAEDPAQPSVQEARQRAGRLGGPSRAKALTSDEREKIARMGANARWKKD